MIVKQPAIQHFYLLATPVRLATLDSSLWIQSLSIEQNTSHGYHFQDIKYYLVPDEDLKVREEKIDHNFYYNGSTIWRLYFPYWYCLKGSYISFNSCLIAVDDSLGLSNLSLFTRYYNYECQVEDHPYVTWKNFTLIVNGSEANLNCTTHEFIVPFDTFIFFRYYEPVNAALMFNITGMRWYLNATDLSNITAFGSSFSDDYPKVEKQFVTFPQKNTSIIPNCHCGTQSLSTTKMGTCYTTLYNLPQQNWNLFFSSYFNNRSLSYLSSSATI